MENDLLQAYEEILHEPEVQLGYIESASADSDDIATSTDITYETIAATGAAHSIADTLSHSLIYGGTLQAASISVNVDGGLVTNNADGEEIVRINTEGLFIRGRLLIDANGGVRFT